MTVSQIVILAGVLALLITAAGRKRTRAIRLGFCALFAGVFIAIFYERYLPVPEVEFIRSYISRWKPSSLKQAIVLFFANVLYLFFGWLIMVLGVSRLNTWKGLDSSDAPPSDDKNKTHKLGFDESDALGCILSLPFAAIAIAEWGILTVGFLGLSLGWAGTARLLYSIVRIVFYSR